MCREINSTHAKDDGLQPEQRFLVAARIAAITLFTGRLPIQPDTSTLNEHGTLNVGAFTGEQIRIDGLDIGYIYEAGVTETLETALFQGSSKRQWVHQTYAEFLAGWYVSRTLQTPQIKSLIFHPSGRIIPQLKETAAWIAASNAEVSAQILESDPEILLRSDIAVEDYESRNRLAQALLRRADTDPRFRTDWSRTRFLMNPALAQTLRPYLEDAKKSIDARKFAILCADECEVLEVQDTLLKIALNPEEPFVLRVAATEVIAHIGSDDSRIQIKPIAAAPLGSHDSGDLKFEAIRCVWPKFITIEELFESLDTYDREDIWIDRYSTADWGKLILPNLSISEIPIALEWVQVQRRSHELSTEFAELFDKILALAWSHLDEPEIASAFAQTAIVL